MQIHEKDGPTVLTFKNFTKITDIHTSGSVVRNHKNVRRIKYSTEVYVPIVVSDLSSSSATSTSPGSLSQNVVIPTLRPATTRSESMSSQVWGVPSSVSTESEKQEQKWGQRDRTERPVAWPVSMTKRIYEKILWTKEFQHTGTHPRVLPVNQLQDRWKMWYRVSTVFSLAEGPKLRHLQEIQDNKDSLQNTHHHSHISSRTFWRLDNSRSQSS